MSSSTGTLMLRWSWRDLRRRWGLVLVTAFIIAIGTGTYAGLGGSSPWRLSSLDASYETLGYHHLHVGIPISTTVAAGELTSNIDTIASIDQVEAMEERLLAPVQVDASTDDATILVPGQVVGTPADGTVDTVHLVAGRRPQPGSGDVLLEAKFVRARDLPTSGTILLSGGRSVRYTGTGVAPEYFSVLGNGQQVTGAYGYAVVFADLQTAQDLAGFPGKVNDAVVRLAGEPTDEQVAAIGAEVEVALADVGGTVAGRDDDIVRRSLYADARNDQKIWTAMSLLILLGASFAAFNLVSRMVEAERHEIGVAMALGTPSARLSIRPLLVGFQIAVLGVVLGIGVGIFASGVLKDVLVDFVPLPNWITSFPTGRYLQAATAGIVLPMLATIIPVRRALQVEPVDALRPQTTGRARGVGFVPSLSRARHGGRVVAMMPIRNVLRAPRRTLLTALGIGAAITTLVATLGMLDSIGATFDRSDTELARAAPHRLEVALSQYQPVGSDVVAATVSAAGVARAEPGLQVGGIMRHGDVEIETFLELIDLGDAMWTPTTVAGRLPVDGPGLVISEKAASDLDVGPGDTLTLEHPVRDGVSYRMVESEIEVAAIHPDPLRFLTYLDASQASLFDLEGIVNQVVVDPDPGVSPDDVKRTLFETQGVTSVQEVATFGEMLQQQLGQFQGVLRILEGFALGLALLIAFNSSVLAMEERRREHATMFAFGLPVRTVLRTIVVEIAITATIGSLVGVAGGYAAMRWILNMVATDSFPEIGLVIELSTMSIATVMVLGVGVATLAPILGVRRLQRTDIPSTLRVLE